MIPENMTLSRLWGSGDGLDPLQMAVRAFVMFFVLVVLVRVGGVRIFGRKSPFDAVVAVSLGAVSARGIVGASSFWATVAAGVVLVTLHRLVAILLVKFPAVGAVFKGKRVCLYRDGQLQHANLLRTSISEADLIESLRLETRQDDLSKVFDASMEANGRSSFVLRDPAASGQSSRDD